MMRLLIVGGSGYIGSSLVPRLLNKGYDVDIVDLFWFGCHVPEAAGIISKSIFDLTVEDLEGYCQVIFLAGLSNDPMAEFSPGKNFISNVAAPACLAYLSKQAGVRRFIYASSCSVYGCSDNELLNEEAQVIPFHAYGISKLQGERSVLAMCDCGFSVIALRMGTVCGYSPRMRLDLVLNTMFMGALRDGSVTVHNPANWRPILGISDAVDAYISAIEASESTTGVFNVASYNLTVGELADQVCEAIESELEVKIGKIIKGVNDVRSYKVDISKAVKGIGFCPTQSTPAIIKELFRNVTRFNDWDNPNYYNIRVFTAREFDETIKV